MKFSFYLLIFLMSFSYTSVSQTIERLPCIDKKFSIVMHIVKDSLGGKPYDTTDLLKDIVSLNKNFAPICVSFEVCEFKYIDNFRYLRVDKDKEWKEMQVLYNLKNRINVYYVKTITNPPAPAAGFAGLGSINDFNDNGIVLKEVGERTLSHEMGHYFGLEHTFETGHGSELVDGSNCLTAGDSICDTPADPNKLPALCSPTMQKDAKGYYYDPMFNNIMSYYDPTCACNPGFTRGQYIKMAKTYLGKKGMW